MTQYRYKEVFQAQQLTESDCWASWENRVPFFGEFSVSGSYHSGDRKIWNAHVYIPSPDGFAPDLKVEIGNWLVKRANGVYEVLTAKEFADMIEEVSDIEACYTDEKAIVDKIWLQLGCITYADAVGKSIYDLIRELQDYRQQRSMEDWKHVCETEIYHELKDASGKFRNILDLLFDQRISPGKAAEAIVMRANGVEPSLPKPVEAKI